jgi:rubrerythrin
MSKYIAYINNRTFSTFETFSEASYWLMTLQNNNEGRIYQNIVGLHKRKCHKCGFTSYYKTPVKPTCPVCNSLDTRRVIK